LNAHTTIVKSGEKSIKVPAVASDGELWVSKVLATIQALEHDTKHVSLMNDPDKTKVALRTKALYMAARLKTVSELYLCEGRDINCWYRYHRNQQRGQNCCYSELSCISIVKNRKTLIMMP
jgi:hypothetical protein